MTNQEAIARNAQYSHISVETWAYTDGRNSVWEGKVDPCEFTDPNLIAHWKRGVRHVLAEDRLSTDTEWDGEEE